MAKSVEKSLGDTQVLILLALRRNDSWLATGEIRAAVGRATGIWHSYQNLHGTIRKLWARKLVVGKRIRGKIRYKILEPGRQGVAATLRFYQEQIAPLL